MEQLRRVRVLASIAAILVVGAGVALRPAALRAGDPPWDPPPCPPGAAPGVIPAGSAWFSLDPDLDGQGWLAGIRLSLGDLLGRTRHWLELPPESFASGPVGARLLVGDDDGSRSRLRMLDVAGSCAVEVGREASVIRSAIQSPDGRVAWEHRVNRVTRADEGVWARRLDGSLAVRVAPGLPPDDRFGPTFTTELESTADGRLTIASCGELRCRVRLLDPASGRIAQADGTGRAIGTNGDQLIAYAPCHGYPCRIESIDLGSGRRTTLADAAGTASLGGPDDRMLVFETAPGLLATLDLQTLELDRLSGEGRVPVGRGSWATSGASVRLGAVLLAPDGHLVDPGDARQLDPSTLDRRPLAEVEP